MRRQTQVDLHLGRRARHGRLIVALFGVQVVAKKQRNLVGLKLQAMDERRDRVAGLPLLADHAVELAPVHA
eukprot:355473-Chlamydomonas_euryale.AAC.3